MACERRYDPQNRLLDHLTHSDSCVGRRLNPLPVGSTFSSAINDRSEVVGTYQDEQSQRGGVLRQRGKITRIETAPGEFASVYLLTPEH